MEKINRSTPDQLPVLASECKTLKEWRELKLGMSQREVAAAAGKKQSRISEVENGSVMPRKKLWPELMRGYQLQGQEAEFYRMIVAARKDRLKERALLTPREATPLLDPAQNPNVKPLTPGVIQGLNAHANQEAPILGEKEQSKRAQA